MDRQKAHEAHYRETHREERKQAAKQDRAVHGDQINERRRKTYAEKHGILYESPAARAHRLEHQRAYQAANKERITAYHREYYASGRQKPAKFSPCPDCGKSKAPRATRCKPCSYLVMRKKKRVRLIPACTYCLVELRSITWRGKKLLHCPACGLETTLAEITRVVYEEAA